MASSIAERRSGRGLQAAVLAALAAVPVADLQAQEAGARTVLEELVVTARKREELLQDVPLSITAFSAEDIARGSLDTISDLALVTPGLNMSNPFGRLNPTAALRGMSNPGVGEEQMVGFFIDGVYISGRSSLDMLLTDLERIEVTRGPQGALYGRNTFAGAVNFVTRRPSEVFEADATATAGNRNRYDVRGSIGGQLTDGLSGRLGAVYRSWGGFYRNANPAGPDIGDSETTAFNGSLLWEPTDTLELRARIMTSRDRDENPAQFLVAANSENGGFFTGTLPQRAPNGYNIGPSAGFERDTTRGFLTANWSLSDTLTVESISAYTDDDIFYSFDASLTPASFFLFEQDTSRRDFSQDLRLAWDAPAGDRRWLLGASWYEFRNRLLDNVHAPGFGQPRPNLSSTTQTESWSLYGAYTMDFATAWQLSLELRYLSEAQRFRSDNRDLAGDPLRLKDDWSSWLPRVSLSHTLSDDVLLYASVAKGFKSGGFNDQQNVFPQERSYDPEENWTYEAGTKLTLGDGQATLNLGVFYVDWRDQQISSASQAGPSANTYVTNAAASTVKGVEVELLARMGEHWTLQAGYALADAKFDEFLDVALAPLPSFAPDGDVSGNQLPRQSKHQINLVTTFEQDVAALAGTRWYLRSEVLYQSKQYSTSANLASTGHSTRVNLRAGLVAQRWEASLWVRNVFDDRTPPVGIRFIDAANSLGNGFFARAWNVSPADGRTVGATFTVRYGGE